MRMEAEGHVPVLPRPVDLGEGKPGGFPFFQEGPGPFREHSL